ncbi:hypothetical protein MJ1HA_1256 [Metallosphaera sedula]|nr:hypothetical protein MJ1HA_1256 [Metallosphaera sedula]
MDLSLEGPDFAKLWKGVKRVRTAHIREKLEITDLTVLG